MIDILYTLGSESKYDNQELRYSLRSLSYLKDLGNVFIIGYLPEWVKNVNYIQAQDPYLANKDANLINKIILGCQDNRLSDEFLWFSDDQVLLKECSIENFTTPIIDNSHLVNFKSNSFKHNRWSQRLLRTITVLKEKGYKQNCYESHAPYLLNKHIYPNVLFNYDYGCDLGYCGNTLYFNTLEKQGRENCKDLVAKLLDSYNHTSQIEEICKNKTFLNYSDKAINENLLLYLQNKFPNKSKYE